jgi:hypothetical protein
VGLRAGTVKARRPRAAGVPNAAAALGWQRGGGAKRSALYGAEHSAKLSHVMAGSSALHDPIPKTVDVAFRQPGDDVETMRLGTRRRKSATSSP